MIKWIFEPYLPRVGRAVRPAAHLHPAQLSGHTAAYGPAASPDARLLTSQPRVVLKGDAECHGITEDRPIILKKGRGTVLPTTVPSE
ncbi:hypothetical protein GCM10010216_21900 [Streptomyces flaveolus]|nr:hypothetical protein GCM10010216_21900 [Streptomyces flaveolus]